MAVNDYLNLIPSQHRSRPKFMAIVGFFATIYQKMIDILTMTESMYDIDFAVGVQLDFIGEWVGISRNVSIPVTGLYFSFDDVITDGWDLGLWRGENEPTTITRLPDEQYRTLLKAKIAANNWDGTTENAYAIWSSVFVSPQILIQDNQDLSYDFAFVGGMIDSLTLALLTRGYIPLKPEGITIAKYIVPIDSGRLFAWDTDNAYLAGWDTGSFGTEIMPL